MKTRMDLKSDRSLCFFLGLIVFNLIIINLSVGLQELTGVQSSTVSIVCKGFLGVIFITLIPKLVHNITTKTLLSIYLTVSVITAQLLFFPNLDIFFKNTAFTFCTGCLTSFVVGASISDVNQLRRTLDKVSNITGVVVLIFMILVFSGKITQSFKESYSMGFGYAMVVPTLCLISHRAVTSREKILKGILIVGFMMAIMSFGSRGPLLGIGLYILYFELRKLFEKREFAKMLLCVAIIIVAYASYKGILLYFSNVLMEYGINSRTLRLMAGNGIYLSKRDILWEKLMDTWKNHPFSIRGINAEWEVIGYYAHNIIFELLYQFGLIVGGIILSLIASLIIQQLIYPKRETRNDLCVLLLFASVPELLFSNSIWESYIFWMWIGLSIGKGLKGEQSEENTIS